MQSTLFAQKTSYCWCLIPGKRGSFPKMKEKRNTGCHISNYLLGKTGGFARPRAVPLFPRVRNEFSREDQAEAQRVDAFPGRISRITVAVEIHFISRPVRVLTIDSLPGENLLWIGNPLCWPAGGEFSVRRKFNGRPWVCKRDALSRNFYLTIVVSVGRSVSRICAVASRVRENGKIIASFIAYILPARSDYDYNCIHRSRREELAIVHPKLLTSSLQEFSW